MSLLASYNCDSIVGTSLIAQTGSDATVNNSYCKLEKLLGNNNCVKVFTSGSSVSAITFTNASTTNFNISFFIYVDKQFLTAGYWKILELDCGNSNKSYIYLSENSSTAQIQYNSGDNGFITNGGSGYSLNKGWNLISLEYRQQFGTLYYSFYCNGNGTGGSTSATGYSIGNFSIFAYPAGIYYLDEIKYGETTSDVDYANSNSVYLDLKNNYNLLTNKIPNYNIFDDCVSYYDFRNDAKDLIGGNDGTTTASLTTNRFNIVNTAYSIPEANPASDDISCGSTGISASQGTMCMWVKTDNFNVSSYGGYFDTNPSIGGALRLFIDSSTGTGNMRYETGGTSSQTFAHGMNTTDWYFLTLTWSGTTTTVFIDAVQKATYGSNTTPTIGSNFYIGSINNRSIDANYDNCMIFNRVLTNDEITYLYNLTKNKNVTPIIRGGKK